LHQLESAALSRRTPDSDILKHAGFVSMWYIECCGYGEES
jgi:hypothetical protein